MMPVDRVILLGDSFTFGHGCSDRIYYYDEDLKKFVGDITPIKKCIPSEYCWATLLQKEFPNLIVHNLSQPGHCNQGMFRNLLDFCVENNYHFNDLIIFNGTFSDRIEVKAPALNTIGSWSIGWEYMEPGLVQLYKEYSSAKKEYAKYLYHDDIGINLTLSSLLGAYGYATLNNHNFLYSLPISPNPVINSNIHCINNHKIAPIFDYDFSRCEDYDINKTCYAPDYHVNDKGHSIYYEEEIKPRIQQFISK